MFIDNFSTFSYDDENIIMIIIMIMSEILIL